MKDKELDDLFRRNADYLADEPPRDFDKDAFWQQLQTELPKQADRQKRPVAWWWAAASALLAGMLGAIWWMQSAELGAEKELAGKVEVKTTQTPRTRPRIGNATSDSTNAAPLRGLQPSKLLAKKQNVMPRPIQPESNRIVVKAIEIQPKENLLPLENEPDLPEVVPPTIPIKPVYRVVHINEIRQRKQQEAKAQSRMTFRLGIPAPPSGPEPPEGQFKLSIPIPH